MPERHVVDQVERAFAICGMDCCNARPKIALVFDQRMEDFAKSRD